MSEPPTWDSLQRTQDGGYWIPPCDHRFDPITGACSNPKCFVQAGLNVRSYWRPRPNPYGGLTAQREYSERERKTGEDIARALRAAGCAAVAE